MSVGAYVSDIESVAAPEPTVIDVEAQALATEAAYTYQRSDGTFEQAMSAEDAIARCPVLGKLAMETPEQASILLELAASPQLRPTQERPKTPREAEPATPRSQKKPGLSLPQPQTMRPDNERPFAPEVILPAAEREREEFIKLAEAQQDVLTGDPQQEPHRDKTARPDGVRIVPAEPAKPKVVQVKRLDSVTPGNSALPKPQPVLKTKPAVQPRNRAVTVQVPPSLTESLDSSAAPRLPRREKSPTTRAASFREALSTKRVPEQPKTIVSFDGAEAEAGATETIMTDTDFSAVQLEDNPQPARIENTDPTIDYAAPLAFIETSLVEAENENQEQPVLQLSELPLAELRDVVADDFETAQIEAALESFGTAIQEKQCLLEDVSGEEKARIEEDLEVLCVHFFECLDIEYDGVIIQQFIEDIKVPKTAVDRDMDTLTIQALNNLGTREYKPSGSLASLKGLAQLVREKIQPHLMVGRCALRACAG